MKDAEKEAKVVRRQAELIAEEEEFIKATEKGDPATFSQYLEHNKATHEDQKKKKKIQVVKAAQVLTKDTAVSDERNQLDKMKKRIEEDEANLNEIIKLDEEFFDEAKREEKRSRREILKDTAKELHSETPLSDEEVH